jgi:NADPH-dependent curcumin reductase CurA
MPTKDQFRTETATLPALQDGEVLTKALYFSVDPYMRGRMNDAKSYVAPYKIDQPITGGGIGKIVETNSPTFQKSDVVHGNFPWARARQITGSIFRSFLQKNKGKMVVKV